jgi:putative ABC transport system permease protein
VISFEVFRIALAALRANKLRSMLTMLGIVIGVAAVIAMVAIGNGAQQSVHDRIAKLGTTILQIDASHDRTAGVAMATFKKMTPDDAKAIEERAPHVIAVQPQQDKNMQVVWGDRNTNIRVYGVTPNYLVVRNFTMEFGRFFTPTEEEAQARVAVLGADALTDLGVTNPFSIIGHKVRIAGIQFTVIGVLTPKGAGSGWGSVDEQVLVPFSTGRFRLFGTERVDDIFALATSEADLPLATTEIELAMRHSHRIARGMPDDFRIRNQADFLSTLGETTAVFTNLLAGIAAVSLLVGGIGIMNIMLVSVTERTREIGIRKALGATRRTILLQFLIEAVTLSVAGGMIGIAIGIAGATVLKQGFGWSAAVGASSIFLAFAFSACVGVLFGVWPARRAASLDPIIALRYE